MDGITSARQRQGDRPCLQALRILDWNDSAPTKSMSPPIFHTRPWLVVRPSRG